jgi:hypothetical protein
VSRLRETGVVPAPMSRVRCRSSHRRRCRDLRVGTPAGRVASDARSSRGRARERTAVERSHSRSSRCSPRRLQCGAVRRMPCERAPRSEQPHDPDEQSSHEIRRPVDGEIEPRVRVGEEHRRSHHEGPAPPRVRYNRRATVMYSAIVRIAWPLGYDAQLYMPGAGTDRADHDRADTSSSGSATASLP